MYSLELHPATHVFILLTWTLLGLDMLQWPGLMHKVIRIRLRHHLPLLWLLHVVLIPLLLSEHDCFVLGSEFQVGALHEVARGLPAHQRVLPSVAFGQRVPVQPPVFLHPGAGLGGWFGGSVDSVAGVSSAMCCEGWMSLPYCPGL